MVHYSCALGRKLFKYLPDETIMYDEANYTCQWDRTWWPDTEVGRSITIFTYRESTLGILAN